MSRLLVLEPHHDVDDSEQGHPQRYQRFASVCLGPNLAQLLLNIGLRHGLPHRKPETVSRGVQNVFNN